MSFWNELKIPVNPEYDFTRDPATQAEYVNPVVLNNMEVRQANAAIEVSDRLGRHQRRLAELKVELDEAEAGQEDLETEILTHHPAPTNDRKTNKLLDAYVRGMAEQLGKREELQTLVDRQREIRREILLTEAAIEAARQAWQCIRLLGEHGQTHLSFVKQEYKQARGY